MNAQRLIAEIFGVELADGGAPPTPADASALLNVPINAPDAQVIDALRACLVRLDAHPLGRGEGGVQARVAIHAAAARLLELGDAPGSTQPPDHGLAHELARTLAQHGGWNRAAMAQFALIARRENLEVSELLGVLRQMQSAPREAAGPGSGAATARPSRPTQGSSPARKAASLSLPVRSEQPVPASEDIDNIEALLASSGGAGERERNANVGKAAIVLLGLAAAAFLAIGAVVIIIVMTLTSRQAQQQQQIATTPTAPSTPPGPVAVAAPAQTTGTPAVAPGPRTQPEAAKNDVLAPLPQRAEPGPMDFAALQRDLRACVEGISTDAAAACERFESLLPQLARRWPEGSGEGAIVVVVGDVVEFVYRAGSAGAPGRKAVGAIESMARSAMDQGPLGVDEALEGAFIAGVSSRLMRERDLPTASWSIAESAYRASFAGTSSPTGTNFANGAGLWLSSAMPRLFVQRTGTPVDIDAESAAALEAWLVATEAIHPEGSRERAHAILSALNSLLTAGPELTATRWAYDAAETLMRRVTWRAGDESRLWLLRWLASSAVTSSDLNTITRLLAEKSNAEGVDLSMVLSQTAGDGERAELRDRYAVVWGITSPKRGEMISRWLGAAQAEIAREGSSEPVAALARSVRLARLSRAARMVQSGDTSNIEALINAETPAVAGVAAPVPVTPAASPNSRTISYTAPGTAPAAAPSVPTGWATRYIGAGANIPVRREILAGISSTPTAIEAQVLVEEAGRGSPWQVREAARNVVERFANEPTIVEAMLRFAPLIPATVDNAELLERVAGARLPAPRSARWRVEARRALVERLLQLLAASGPAQAIDPLSELLGEAYAPVTISLVSPASGGSDTQDGSAEADQVDPAEGLPVSFPIEQPIEIAARAFRVQLEAQAAAALPTGREPITREQIASNLAVRGKVASGRIHQFLAEQSAIAETLALLASIERPEQAARITTILGELDASRKSSPHAFQQIESCERAILALWAVRLGEDSPT